MKKIIGIFLLMVIGVSAAHAGQFTVTDMRVSTARIEADFFPSEGSGIDLNVISNENIVGDYVGALTSTFFGPAGEQILYTAASNNNPHGVGMPAGMLPGGPVPSATVNMERQTITVDMSSFFSAHGMMDQNLGNTAHGTYQPGTGEYTITWSAILTQGNRAGQEVNFILTGTAEVKPTAYFKKN